MIEDSNVADQPVPATDAKGAVKERLQAWLDSPVVTIELTPEQQAQLSAQTNGRVSATSIKLRPNLDLTTFLSEATDVDMSDIATGLAPPPKGQIWTIAGTA